jgi:hypothetical protein
METTDFEDILREAADEVTQLDPADLDTAAFASIRRSCKRRLEEAWEWHYWPDLQRTEKRFFRADWDTGTTYNATDEVYYAPTDKYYQSLQLNSASAPADADGVTDPFNWTECARDYAADTYNAATIYMQGDRATYAGQVYQLFLAGPVSNVLPTDDTQWGLLTPFDQYIAYEQTGQTPFSIVTIVTDGNPRTSTRIVELNWDLSNNGIQITSGVTKAWVDFRLRCPKISGALFDATVSYTSGQQVYFSSTATPGNFYTANTTTAAGDSPDSMAASWDVVELPRIFHKFLVHAIAADFVRGPGGGAPEDAAVLLGVAREALDNAKTLLVGQQSQRVKTVVRTR